MILADHCVWQATIDCLVSAGYSVIALQEVTPTDAKDPQVLAVAVVRDLVLLTNDKGFGNIITYPLHTHTGIIVLRITPATEDRVHQVLLQLLHDQSREQLRHKLAVVDENKYRLRTKGVEPVD